MARQTIGEFLSTLRKANGYTQQEVADRLGVSNKTLSNWECDKVLPDILLLPALAELYGVTVDEIIAGERKEKANIELTSKSEKRILKSKIARFAIQSYILVGIIIVGILLSAFCSFVLATSPFGPWPEILLAVGVVAVVICIGILFAFWKGAELSVDNTTENFDLYCLILRKKLSNCLYVLSATSAFATIGLLVVSFVDAAMEMPYVFYSSLYADIVVCISFAVCTVCLFLTAWLLYKRGLTKFGGETAKQSISKDRNYFWSVCFWGIFPLVLSVVLLIVTACGCLSFTEKITIYENSSVDKFVEYMETIATPDGYRHLPLSELSKTAGYGDKFDLGDGYYAVYYEESFTVYNEMIEMHVDGGALNLNNVTFLIEVPRIYILEDDYVFSFFNARYYWYHLEETGGNFHFMFVGEVDTTPELPLYKYKKFVRYEQFIAERVDNVMAYVRETLFDFSIIGYSVALPVLAVDLIVCAVLCVRRRNKFCVKL